MPNICLIGFQSEETTPLRGQIASILEGMGLLEEAVVTILSSPQVSCLGFVPFKIPGGDVYSNKPYVVVRDTDRSRMRKIGLAINRRRDVDVELQFIDGFLSKK